MSQKVYIASDHAGYSLKKHLIENNPDLAWEDLGPSSEDRVDYPDFADLVSQKVTKDDNSFGILVCGSGQGMALRANKYPQIRAALCWSTDSAHLAREHNNANILCMGSRLVDWQVCQNMLEEFLKTPFAGGRHQDRVNKIHKDLNSST